MLISDGLTAELHVLAALITGSANDETRRRLASQLVSRLMVVYFIQKKGLLDGNQEYLRHKLNQCRQIGEQDSFVAFLEMLCFDGLSTPEPNRSPETRLRLGNVPFLYTEMFGKPSSEALYCQPIQVPDAIFERLFEFFDQYEWQMDGDWSDSPWVVTPDVLGWLLEQRINQKQLGAYFTRDDTTRYISQNTIIPFLLEQIQTEFPTAFEPHGQLWQLLSSHPDRYIYPAIKKGVHLSVPEPVAAGIDDPWLRTQWNEPALADYALPTETWREVVARRQRYAALRARLETGAIHDINQLITENLNLHQFAVDVIEQCSIPGFLFAFWKALERLTILDPTCGAGDFLLAALKTLEPLYSACFSRMQTFLARLPLPGQSTDFEYFSQFALIQKVAECFPNQPYFVLFSIVTRNLFGVDILEDATEVAGQRLLFKLIAQVTDIADTARLADVRLNLRTGNALVGSVTPKAIPEIDQSDRFLKDIDHQNPMHWFDEFPEVFARGGFEVIVGNPPYVKLNKHTIDYQLSGFTTLPCQDLYACVLERAYALLKNGGRLGVIVPISMFGTDGFATLQAETLRQFDCLWTAFFANRPTQLFDGAQKRLTLVLGRKGTQHQTKIHTTAYLRWSKEERESLFETRIGYATPVSPFQVFAQALEKLGSELEMNLFSKLVSASSGRMRESLCQNGKERCYYTRKFGYFLAFTDFIPHMTDLKTRQVRRPSELKELRFQSQDTCLAAIAVLSSATFFWFWNVLSDCRNLNRRDILAFPLNVASLPGDLKQSLSELGRGYLEALKATSTTMLKSGLVVETFEYKACKPILDEIDRLLANQFGFTAEELDFILNYDFKYRMTR
ncbi:MAG TPA: hypothetical protein PLB32_18365 [Acidobacteriota bacterium]|nr:hypothetical protein [Acidobacteriota bacterium]